MTPVSKKRKSGKPTAGGPVGRRPVDRKPADPALELYRKAVPLFAAQDQNPLPQKPLELASGMVAWMEHAEGPSMVLDTELFVAVVEHAERLALPGSVALLTALAATAWPRENNPRNTPLVNKAARIAENTAGILQLRGHQEPAWAGPLRSLKVTRAVELVDVFGDFPLLVFEFRAARRKFALSVAIDSNHMGGYALGLVPLPGLVRHLKDLAAEATADPLLRAPAELDVETAVERARRALAATDMTSDPELSEGFAELRGFAYACLGRRSEDAERPRLTELDFKRLEIEERDERDRLEVAKAKLARQFQEEAKARPAGVNRSLADRYLEFSHGYDDDRYTRISPTKIRTFLEWYLPGKVMLDAAEVAALPGFVQRWLPWCGEQEGLSEEAVGEVGLEAIGSLNRLRAQAEGADADDQGPGAGLEEAPGSMTGATADGGDADGGDHVPVGQLFLQGLNPGSLEEMQTALRVRQLAMPYFGTRIGPADYPQLNANKPAQLRLLVLGELPEFHAIAADALPVTDDDGDLAFRAAVRELVVNQLWHQTPAEVAAAALRLEDAGMRRPQILAELQQVLAGHLDLARLEVLRDPARINRAVDLPGYRAQLATLGARGRGGHLRGV